MRFKSFLVFCLVLLVVGVVPACALQVPVVEESDFGHDVLIFSHLSYLKDNVSDFCKTGKETTVQKDSVVSESVKVCSNVSDGSSQLLFLVDEGDRLYPVVKSTYDKYCSKVDKAVKAHDELLDDYKSVVEDRLSAESALDSFELSTSNSAEYNSLKDRYDSLVCEEKAITAELDKADDLMSQLNQKREYYRSALDNLNDLKNSKDVVSALKSVDDYKESIIDLKKCDENINDFMIQSSSVSSISASSVSSVDESVSGVDGVTVDSVSDLSTSGMGVASDFNANNSSHDELTTINTANNDTNNTLDTGGKLLISSIIIGETGVASLVLGIAGIFSTHAAVAAAASEVTSSIAASAAGTEMATFFSTVPVAEFVTQSALYSANYGVATGLVETSFITGCLATGTVLVIVGIVLLTVFIIGSRKGWW